MSLHAIWMLAIALVPTGVEERPTGPVGDDPPVMQTAPAAGRTVAPALVQKGGFTSVQVNIDGDGNNTVGDAANEPSIVVLPTARNRIVVGWREFPSVESDHREAGWGVSTDGGRSWQVGGTLGDEGRFGSDPVLEADADGRVFYLSLRPEFRGCELFVSGDHGGSWIGPLEGLGGDKPWMAVDRTGGPGHGAVYVTWDSAYSCCGDAELGIAPNGVDFLEPMDLDPGPYWGTLAIGDAGELYWAGATGIERFTAVRVDNPYLGAESATVTTVELPFEGFLLPGGAPNSGGLVGQVWTDIDRSGGPRHGTVYVLTLLAPDGPDPAEIMLTRSGDRGETWSQPVRVPDSPPGLWEWFPTFAVSPTGRLDVVWYQSVDEYDPAVTELRWSTSEDGGESWTPSAVITPRFRSDIGDPGGQRRLGDYVQIRSDELGADLVYAATFNDEQDIWYLRLGERDCDGSGISDAVEIQDGALADLDRDGLPDACELAAGAAGDRQVITAAANASGLLGTQWRTDLSFHNPTSSEAAVSISWLTNQPGTTAPDAVTVPVPAEASLLIDDATASLFAVYGVGGLLLQTDISSLVIHSRTYNDAVAGSFGQGIAARPAVVAVSPGSVAQLIGLHRSGDPASGMRTNLGFTNPLAEAAEVEIDVVDADGAHLGTLRRSIPPMSQHQITDALAGLSITRLRGASATVRAVSGAVIPYASVVDNVTGDPVYLEPAVLLTGDSVVPAVARTPGLNDTLWRTELVIHNPGQETVEVEITMLPSDDVAPQTAALRLDPGTTRVIDDLMGTAFGINGTGATMITSQRPILATSRTYTVREEGSLGQLVPVVPSAEGLRFGESAVLTMLSRSADSTQGFRTNIGLVNIASAPATVRLELYRDDGELLKAVDVTVPARSHRQLTDVFAMAGDVEVPTGWARISPTSTTGRVISYASVVDNRSGDPVWISPAS